MSWGPSRSFLKKRYLKVHRFFWKDSSLYPTNYELSFFVFYVWINSDQITNTRFSMEEISLNWSMGVMLRNSRLYLWWKVGEKTVISSQWVSSLKQCPLLAIIGFFLAVNGKHAYDMLSLDFALQEALGQTGDSACLWMTHPHCNVPVYFYFSDLYFSFLFFHVVLYMPLIYL